MSDTPRVTVIMRTKDSDWVVGQALAGLFSQSFRDFELLVMDSGSVDRTRDILNDYPCKIIDVERKRYFPGVVLNDAMEAATTDLVVFQNSDVVPLNPFALERLVSALDDPSVDAAFARQTPRPEALAWVRRDYAAAFPERGSAPSWLPFSLPFAAMRKSAWRAHPFYTDAWASEDTEWGEWATRNGRKIRYVPDSVVMHSHNYNLRQLFGRRFVEGEADAFIYGDADTFWRMTSRTIRSIGNDIWYSRGQDLGEIVMSPIRRSVYQWAYLKGNRLGRRRIREGVQDASEGQQFILSRHDH